MSAFAMPTYLGCVCNARLHITVMRLVFRQIHCRKAPFSFGEGPRIGIYVPQLRSFLFCYYFLSIDISPLCGWCSFVLVREDTKLHTRTISNQSKLVVDIAPFSFGEGPGMRTEMLDTIYRTVRIIGLIRILSLTTLSN